MAIPAADVAPVLISVLLTAGLAVVLVLRGPVGGALARRIEGGTVPDESALERIGHLELRVTELETGQQRVTELENRLEFAERLLTSTDAQRSPSGVSGQ
jgi:hypothetical protein